MLLFYFLFAYIRFVLFVRVNSFCKKSQRSLKLPWWPHLHYYRVKSYFYFPWKNVPAVFADSKQSKSPFGETAWLTGRHATSLVTLIFIITMLLTGHHPCQWSSSDLSRVLRIWENVFYSQAFLTLHPFLLVSRPPCDRQFSLKVSRASCWSSKHSPHLTICLNHNNPQRGL